MKIQWLGHSSFRILGSKTIVTDPYGEIGLRFPDVRADIVTVSHGHHDHNAVEAVKGEPAIVDDAGMHKIADLSIMGYNTAHDDEQGAKRGHNIVFVIQMDGTRVAHLGDIGCIPDHNVLGALQKVDVLLLPVGGNYTIDGRAGRRARQAHPAPHDHPHALQDAGPDRCGLRRGGLPLPGWARAWSAFPDPRSRSRP